MDHDQDFPQGIVEFTSTISSTTNSAECSTATSLKTWNAGYQVIQTFSCKVEAAPQGPSLMIMDHTGFVFQFLQFSVTLIELPHHTLKIPEALVVSHTAYTSVKR